MVEEMRQMDQGIQQLTKGVPTYLPKLSTPKCYNETWGNPNFYAIPIYLPNQFGSL